MSLLRLTRAWRNHRRSPPARRFRPTGALRATHPSWPRRAGSDGRQPWRRPQRESAPWPNVRHAGRALSAAERYPPRLTAAWTRGEFSVRSPRRAS